MYNSIPFKSNVEAKDFLKIVFMISSSMGVSLQFRIDILWLSRYSRLVFEVLDSDGHVKMDNTKVKIATIASDGFFFVVCSLVHEVFVMLGCVCLVRLMRMMERIRI